jgi:hypothetical protein
MGTDDADARARAVVDAWMRVYWCDNTTALPRGPTRRAEATVVDRIAYTVDEAAALGVRR